MKKPKLKMMNSLKNQRNMKRKRIKKMQMKVKELKSQINLNKYNPHNLLNSERVLLMPISMKEKMKSNS